MEKIYAVNPKMLVWARQLSGITFDELQSKGFSVDKIKAWELGEDAPSYPQLRDLFKEYRKPVAVCFFPEPPKIANIPASCRTLPIEMTKYITSSLIKYLDMARTYQINLYELNNNVNPINVKISDLDIRNKSISDTATIVRQLLLIDINQQKRIKKCETAFNMWREALYNIGIYVFKQPFGDTTLSGFCLYDKEFPVIFVNNTVSFSRQIFTLFHELYHIIYRTSGLDFYKNSEIEKYSIEENSRVEILCNEFAGEFLVPEKDLLSQIHNCDINETLIHKLANSYCVSRDVVIRRLYKIEQINEKTFLEKCDCYYSDYERIKQVTNNKNKGDFYNNHLAYNGIKYTELSFQKYYNNKINIVQLSQYMNMKIPQLSKLADKKGWGTL